MVVRRREKKSFCTRRLVLMGIVKKSIAVDSPIRESFENGCLRRVGRVEKRELYYYSNIAMKYLQVL
ncbi:MAG: hypothetical protein ACJAZ9_000592 [Neolewinella sp.]|jgi:hypothetical protein